MWHAACWQLMRCEQMCVRPVLQPAAVFPWGRPAARGPSSLVWVLWAFCMMNPIVFGMFDLSWVFPLFLLKCVHWSTSGCPAGLRDSLLCRDPNGASVQCGLCIFGSLVLVGHRCPGWCNCARNSFHLCFSIVWLYDVPRSQCSSLTFTCIQATLLSGSWWLGRMCDPVLSPWAVARAACMNWHAWDVQVVTCWDSHWRGVPLRSVSAIRATYNVYGWFSCSLVFFKMTYVCRCVRWQWWSGSAVAGGQLIWEQLGQLGTQCESSWVTSGFIIGPCGTRSV